MFKRCELHNHTTESDASITCEELIEIMRKDRVDAFAITDHNTISGHRIIRALLAPHSPACIYGMEYTTYYGHILCLNLERYVPWDSIDKNHPEKLFEAAKAAGALTGIAHPFSFGDPFARGCHFDMTVTDFSSVDFIEIFNNLEPLHEVNEKALLWWEELTLSGQHLAITSGMDLHGNWPMGMHFATYIEGDACGSISAELDMAIKKQRTWVSKGVLLLCIPDMKHQIYQLLAVNAHKPGWIISSEDQYIATLKSRDSLVRVRLDPFSKAQPEMKSEVYKQVLLQANVPESDILAFGTVFFSDFSPSSPIIPKLYRNEEILENLVCVAPII